MSFQIVGPWTRPARMVPPASNRTTEVVAIVATAVVVPSVLIGGLLLARRNLRRGRGDRRGAVRLAVLVFGLAMVQWLVGASHFANVSAEQARFGAALASALVAAALYGLLYLAVEPQVRRIRPEMLITWSRLVSGRLRDPMVGRDLVAGAVVGLSLTLVTYAHYLLPGWFGWAEFTPPASRTEVLGGAVGVVYVVVEALNLALQNALIGGVGLILVRLVVPSLTTAFIAVSVPFAFLAARGQIETERLWLDLFVGALLVVPILGAIVRYGFVAGVAGFFVHFLTMNVPTSLDPSRLYFGASMTAAVVVVGMVVAGFVLARRREPVFGRVIRDD